MTITTEKLDEIERGLEGVTPGPWAWRDRHRRTLPRLFGPGSEIMNFGDDTEFYPSEGLPPEAADAAHIARMDPTTVAELVRLARVGLAVEARPDIAAVLRGEAVVVPREASEAMIGAGGDYQMMCRRDCSLGKHRAGEVYAAMIAAGEKEMGR